MGIRSDDIAGPGTAGRGLGARDLTHASFFSGVGGLDMGLERAGWRTVSFSEIEPYASAVLAERWPDVPNLGDIVELARQHRRQPGDDGTAPTGSASGSSDPGAERVGRSDVGDDRLPGGSGDDARRDQSRAVSSSRKQRRARRPISDDRFGSGSEGAPEHGDDVRAEHASGPGDGGSGDWRSATLWSGGFPCQDLSVAGKRRGMGSHTDRLDTRSGLAYAFLDLVERYRPAGILLENVPGLLTSHRGRDFGALLDRLAELGYWWAYRILDAQYAGVPQRRRRVFIVALHAGAGFEPDSAAEVLSVGTSCERHSAAGDQAGPGSADGAAAGADKPVAPLRARDSQGLGFDAEVRGELIVGSVTAGGMDKHATQNVAAGHYVADQHPTLDTSDGREGNDHPDRLVVGDDQLVSRAVHTSIGRRSGPAGDEVANLVFGRSAHQDYAPGFGTIAARDGKDQSHLVVVGGETVDSSGVRATDGLAGGSHDRDDLAHTLRSDPGAGNAHNTDYVVGPLLASEGGGRSTDLNVPRVEAQLAPTLRVGPATPAAGGPGDTVPVVVAAGTLNSGGNDGGFRTEPGEHLVVDVNGAVSEIAPTVTTPAPGGSGHGSWNKLNVVVPDSAATLLGRASMDRPESGSVTLVPYVKRARAQTDQDDESWDAGDVAPTLNAFDGGDARATVAIPSPGPGDDDELLPQGLDSHRYRCCGNGVVTPVAEWIGHRLRAAVESVPE